jgi:hypothetical protein
MNKAFEIVGLVVLVGIYLALPLTTIWGWIRWTSRSHLPGLSSILSLIGFALATASGILAISTLMYGRAIGGFQYYDPLLLRIYRLGALLSLIGILFSLSGAWRPGPLRWHAPICSAGMLLFWFVQAMGE